MKLNTIFGYALWCPSLLFAQFLQYTPLIPTGEQAGQTWKYTTAQPAATWYQASFSDAAWASGQSVFGTAGTPGVTIRTTWNTADIWLRKSVTLGTIDTALGEIVLRIIYDEDPTVYINGVQALSLSGGQYSATYQTLTIPTAAKNAVVSNGTNLIAVHAHQTAGGQAVDVGLGQGSGKIIVEKMVLWPGRAAPGALGTTAADTPYIMVYRPPAGIPVTATMLFCPGGSYSTVVTNEPQWARDYFLPKKWIVAVLQYRVAPYKHPVPLLDVKRAYRMVKSMTKVWNADSNKICLMGCSAGGHLASTLATHYDGGTPAAPDTIDRVGCKPPVSVFVYPVITMDASFTHMTSRTNLIGNTPSQALIDSLSNEKQVTAATPPAFLVHGTADALVPWKNSQVYYDSCVAHHVRAKFYLITDACGYHGFDYVCGNNWIDTCYAWLTGNLLAVTGCRERATGPRPWSVLTVANEEELLFDISGRLVASGRTAVNAVGLPNGVYLLVKKGDGRTPYTAARMVVSR